MSDLRSLWIKTGRFLAFVTHFLTLGPYSNPRLLTVLPIVSVYSFHYKFLQVTLSCQGMQIFHSSQFSAFSFLRIKTGQSLPPGVRGQRWKPRLGWLPRKQLCWVWATARQPPPTPPPSTAKTSWSKEGCSAPRARPSLSASRSDSLLGCFFMVILTGSSED